MSSQPILPDKWLRAARIFWILLALVGLSILVTSLPGYYQMITMGVPSHGTVEEPGLGIVILGVVNSTLSLASGILSLFLALLLFRNKFENPAIAAVSFYLLLYGIIMTGPLEAWGNYWLGNTDFAVKVQSVLMATPTIAILVLFPNGKIIPGWMKWVLLVSVPWNALALLFPISAENMTGLIILGTLWITLLGCGLYAQIYRYRKVSTLAERQQTKWVVFGFSLWMAYIMVSTYPYFYLTSMPPGSPRPWWASISEIGWWLSLNFLPVSLAVAITRSRLWNIDIVINRTLVYGALTVSTMALYVFVVGTLGNFLNVGDNTFIAFLATGLVAVLFQPLREQLQRGVNRMMYGDRDDPVAVLSKMGEQLEKTGSPEDALKEIVETVAHALKLPYARIELGGSGEIIAAYGEPSNELIEIPLIYQGESIGQMMVAQRSPGESFNAKDQQLLENLARQAGTVAHAAQLTLDLQQSRQRLVNTREEERQNIRRNLHDGLGPELASQGLKIAAAARLLKSDPEKAKMLLDDLASQNEAAVGEIRRLVYDLRPAALDELGLVSALRDYASGFNHEPDRASLSVDVREPRNGLPTLPPAIEVAAYRIATEALTNVSRHAGARNCQVTFLVEMVWGKKTLILRINDDGVGMPANFKSGVGLNSMRERAEELAGDFNIESEAGRGTQVSARFPLEEM